MKLLTTRKERLIRMKQTRVVSKREKRAQRDIEGKYLHISWLTIPLYHEDLFALDMLSEVLGSGRNSRLRKALVEEKQIVNSAASYSYTPEYGKGEFTISTLLPGQKACLDKGHDGADEVCYVISGTIVLHLPDTSEYHKLNEGDGILIPEGQSHYSINVGEIKSVTAWACAPHL